MRTDPAQLRTLLWALGALLLASACEGTVTGTLTAPSQPGTFVQPDGDPAAPDACANVGIAASPAHLRRLKVEEQRSAYRDILADPTLAPALEPAAGSLITEKEVEQLNLAVAELVATRKHLTYLPCDAAGAFNAACADAFIAGFGKFAFRRPLRDAEKAWLHDEIYEVFRNNTQLSPRATFREAIDAVAQAVLQSPGFLYVRNEGVADPALPAGIRRLSGFERASYLSFLLWGTTPDAALLTAAEKGELDTSDGVQAQARRLLESPRAKTAIRTFVSSWLQLDGNDHQPPLEAAPKSATAFPFDSPALRAAMREDVQSLYEQVFAAPGSPFKDLMTSRRAYVNKSLGALYGVTSPPASDTAFAWVDLNPEQRAGLFTRAGFLALYSPQENKSPIRRGVFLLRQALCQPLGDPPANVNNTAIPPSAHARTAREEVENRTAAASCQGCHSRINPLGFTLENYDAMGRFQTTETAVFNGMTSALPIDATATPVGTDFSGAVAGPVALSQALANSGMARDCLATTWFARANERALTAADACSLQRVMRRFRQTDDMRDLVLSVASDDSALFILEAQ